MLLSLKAEVNNLKVTVLRILTYVQTSSKDATDPYTFIEELKLDTLLHAKHVNFNI